MTDKVLEGYREVMPLDGDASAEERLVWDKLTGALDRLHRLARPADGSISGTPAGPVLELLAAATDEGAPIMQLLRR